MKHIYHCIVSAFLFCIISGTANAQVSPLLSTTWNQTCNYNADCPTVSSGGACGKAYTGCNATAMAQILKYYSYPLNSIGGTYCNAVNTSHCVDYSAQTYNYSSMPNNVTSANAEVAKLMYHLGIAVDMQWSGTSSNSFFNSYAMKRFYAYTPRMYGTATFMFNTTQELIDAIKAELDAGRPVFAKGGNHFYLIDGYNASSQFHMNFGWSGVYDGYYSITSVVNGAGTFTPSNFIFMIRPMDGDLETAQDTIVVAAGASSVNTVEFTSLLPWTMTTSDSWISLNMSSGDTGYFTFSEGSHFATTINNGGVRYGYIYIQNANDVDTIVVQQDASPLVVNPVSLTYVAAGGSQNCSIAYYSWGNWTASSPDSWISIAPSSGTGNATISITCAANPSMSNRNGMVIVNGGSFSDTILVDQQGNPSGVTESLNNASLQLFPNPATDKIFISSTATSSAAEFTDLCGNIILRQRLTGKQTELDLSEWKTGMYFIRITDENGIVSSSRFIISR